LFYLDVKRDLSPEWNNRILRTSGQEAGENQIRARFRIFALRQIFGWCIQGWWDRPCTDAAREKCTHISMESL